jgi:hypothetical protein
MATQYYNITGKCAWAHNLFKYDESRYGKRWMVDVYPDEEGMETFNEAGIELRPIKKPLFEGEVGYRFRRDVEKQIKGKMESFQPPKIVDIDGEPWPSDGPRIGNGSTVEINVAVYETRGGDGPKGHRLQGMRVLELVPYEAPNPEATPPVEAPVKTATSPRVKSPW